MKKMLWLGILASLFFGGQTIYGEEKLSDPEAEKTELADKVVNAIDQFDRVKIDFREKFGNLSDREYQVQAKMDFKKGLLDEEFVEKFTDGTVGEQKATLYDKSKEKNLLEIDFKEKNYFADNYTYDSKSGKQALPIEERLSKNKEGENVLIQRSSTLPLEMSADAVLPQLYGAQILSDLNHWEIKKTETILDRKAVVVEGRYPESMEENLNAETFKIWIDEQTGILLKLEGRQKDAVTNYLIVDKIDFDSPVSIRNIGKVKKDNLSEYRYPAEKPQKNHKKSPSFEKNNQSFLQSSIDSYGKFFWGIAQKYF